MNAVARSLCPAALVIPKCLKPVRSDPAWLPWPLTYRQLVDLAVKGIKEHPDASCALRQAVQFTCQFARCSVHAVPGSTLELSVK